MIDSLIRGAASPLAGIAGNSPVIHYGENGALSILISYTGRENNFPFLEYW